jgi:2-methylisocitrate lyase-like PEP mutase family enzyme
MTNTQAEKAALLADLHSRPGIFVIPNPWDAGSAKILEHLGFEALATTSAGLAFSLARQDGKAAISRADTLANAKTIVDATRLPVSGDLENGYGDDPEACAETIRLAAAAGLVGGSIEDAKPDPDEPIYPFDQAVKRVQAAVKAVRSLSFSFTLTARAENFLHGKPDMEDTIRRLQAFAEAGADTLFAPGITTAEQISAIVRAVAPKPVNVVMGLTGGGFTLEQLAALGVRRVSLGSTLARAAYGPFWKAAEEIRNQGTFGFAKTITSYSEFQKIFS